MKYLHSIAAKAVLTVMFVFAGSTILTVIRYFNDVQRVDIAHQEYLDDLIAYMRIPAEDYLIAGTLGNFERLAERTIESNVVAGIVVIDNDNNKISYPKTFNEPLPSIVVPILTSVPTDEFLFDLSGATEENIESIKGKMVVYLDDTAKQKLVQELRKRLMLTFAFSLIMLALILWLIKHYLIKPIHQVFQDATKIIAGDYSSVAQLNQRDELGRLSLYLKQIADSFRGREKKQREDFEQIIRAYSEVSSMQNERDAVIDKLLNGVSPSLQEAMSGIQFLNDKPLIQKNMASLLMYSISLVDETQSLISHTNNKSAGFPENLLFSDYQNLVGDYLNFIAQKKRTQISLKIDECQLLDEKYVLVDRRIIVRLATVLLEFLHACSSKTSEVLSVRLGVDDIDLHSFTTELASKINNDDISENDCLIFNRYFSKSAPAVSTKDLKYNFPSRSGLLANSFTLQGLKQIFSEINGSLTINRVPSGKLVIMLSFRLQASSEPILVEHHSLTRKEGPEIAVVIIGSPFFVARHKESLSSVRGDLRYFHYDSPTLPERDAITHYFVDLTSDRARGLETAHRLISLRSTGCKVTAVLPENEEVESAYLTWCDVDLDGYCFGSITEVELTKIGTNPSFDSAKSEVSKIIEKVKK